MVFAWACWSARALKRSQQCYNSLSSNFFVAANPLSPGDAPYRNVFPLIDGPAPSPLQTKFVMADVRALPSCARQTASRAPSAPSQDFARLCPSGQLRALRHSIEAETERPHVCDVNAASSRNAFSSELCARISFKDCAAAWGAPIAATAIKAAAPMRKCHERQAQRIFM